MGYNLAKRFARDKETFGTGRIDGVLAPETAAHAAGTSALLPMLALGIPGSGTAAILLGGLVWGLNPGPLLFVEHKEFVWGTIASMYLGNVVGLVLVLSTVPLFAAVLRVPFAAVAPMILVSCAIGAYAIQNAMFDIWLMLRLRRARLRVQEARLSAGAAHARTRPRQPHRRCLPAVHDRRRRRPRGVLVERPRRHHHDARARPAVLAGDRRRHRAGAADAWRSHRQGYLSPGCRRRGRCPVVRARRTPS